MFFDSPPLESRPEVRLLLEEVDLAVLVVRSGATTKKTAKSAAEVLAASGVPVLGTVLNAYVPESKYLAST